jgi:mono/diheme cytochrome c family protein
VSLRVLALVAASALVAGCSDSGTRSALAERGRQVYLAQCTACHHPSDPGKPGALGPPIRGTPRAVLEAKLLRGTYPEGYKPKRDSRVMAPMPALAPEIDALEAYLK